MLLHVTQYIDTFVDEGNTGYCSQICKQIHSYFNVIIEANTKRNKNASFAKILAWCCHQLAYFNKKWEFQNAKSFNSKSSNNEVELLSKLNKDMNGDNSSKL